MLALELKDVKKTFRSRRGEVVAVDGVSLEVAERGIFGLLGMNGAGKSTLIGISTGLIRPDGGTARVFGGDPTDAAVRRLVNVSPQETAVAPMLTVGENLEFAARAYGMTRSDARDAARRMAESIGLGGRAGDRAGRLSGGMMRRLSVGMAAVTSPKLVFLDEPTLGLDVVSRRGLWRYIRETAESAAVVLTTHYLEEAEALCDRIAVMAGGRIVAVGSAAELKEKSGAESFEDAFLRLAGEGLYDEEK